MKIKIILVLVLLGFGLFAQVGINTDTPKAMLDINGAIAISDDTMTPVKGKIRYIDDKNCLELYDGSKWLDLCGGGSISNTVLNQITEILNPNLSSDAVVSECKVRKVVSLKDGQDLPYVIVSNDDTAVSTVIAGNKIRYTIKKEGLYNFTYKMDPYISGGAFDGEIVKIVFNLRLNGVNVIDAKSEKMYKGSGGYVVISDRETVYLEAGDVLEMEASLEGTINKNASDSFGIEFFDNGGTYFKLYYAQK